VASTGGEHRVFESRPAARWNNVASQLGYCLGAWEWQPPQSLALIRCATSTSNSYSTHRRDGCCSSVLTRRPPPKPAVATEQVNPPPIVFAPDSLCGIAELD